MKRCPECDAPMSDNRVFWACLCCGHLEPKPAPTKPAHNLVTMNLNA